MNAWFANPRRWHAIAWGLCVTLWAFAALADAPSKAPVPDPVPGNSLEAYQKRYAGLHQTGGFTARGLKKGMELQIFEGKRGKELSYGPLFFSCNPTDRRGLIYLPRLTLVILRTPDHRRTVISEAKLVEFHGPEAIDKFLADNEVLGLRRTPPAANLLDALKRWYARTFKNEKVYGTLFGDRQVKIYRGTLDGGAVGSLLLVPDWNSVIPDEVPVDAKPGGTLERVDYLTRYARWALDDLYPVTVPRSAR